MDVNIKFQFIQYKIRVMMALYIVFVLMSKSINYLYLGMPKY